MLVDSHCHLDRLDLSGHGGSLAQALTVARDQGVGHCLCVAVNLEQFSDLLTIAEQHPQVTISVGVHPTETDCEEPTVAKLVKLAAHPQVVALGETGLDYYRTSRAESVGQRARLLAHIEAAKTVNKPLIIHSRSAREDTIDLLRKHQANTVAGVMHCFTESWEMAQEAMDLGFYISISGIVTFKNAQDLQAVAKQVPLDKLLIETDAPYLAPVPYRGKPNEPAYVRYVAEKIAELKGCTVEAVAQATTENFQRLFKVTI